MNGDKANKKQTDKKTWNLFSLARRPGKGHPTKKKKKYIYISILLQRLLWWLWVALLLAFPPGSERALQAKRCCHESNLGGLTPTADHAWAELVQLQGSSPQRALDVCLLSHVQILTTPWTVSHQAPLSMEFSRQGYLSGLPFLTPGDLSNPGIEHASLCFLHCRKILYLLSQQGSPQRAPHAV